MFRLKLVAKILITKQFNKAGRKLDEKDRKRVFNIYSLMSEMDKKEIFSSKMLTKIVSPDEKIYVVRANMLRIFCTFEKNGENEDLIFLDVVKKTSHKLKVPFNLTKRST